MMTLHNYLVLIACVFLPYAIGDAQNNFTPKLQGKIIVRTHNQDDVRGYIYFDTKNMTVENNWESTSTTELVKKSERLFDCIDSLNKAKDRNAMIKISEYGLQDIFKNGISVDPAQKYAVNLSTYSAGEIVNLKTGKQFSFKELIKCCANGNMYINNLCWSDDGKKLSVSGFYMDEKPYYLIEIDLENQKVITFYKFEKAIEDISYSKNNNMIAVLLMTWRMPAGWFWQFFGGHGSIFYNYYLTIYNSKNKSTVVPEKNLINDVKHNAKLIWVD